MAQVETIEVRKKTFLPLPIVAPDFSYTIYIDNGVIPQNSARLKDNQHNSKITEISW